MNRPPEVFIRVDEERLLNFSIACFEKVGITHEHAVIISRLLVNSDLRGVRSHGTRAVNGYCAGFENGSLNPHPNIRIINETPTTVVLDGNGTLGYLPMVRATERAINKAKEVGIGMGLVRYIGHYGSAGYYSRLCNEDGCIGFSVQGFQNQGNSGSQNPKPQLGYSGNPPSVSLSLLAMKPRLLDRYIVSNRLQKRNQASIGTIKLFHIYPQDMLQYLTYIDSKQDYQMFYLSLTIGFGHEIDQSPLTLYENSLCIFVGFGIMLIALFMYCAGVGF